MPSSSIMADASTISGSSSIATNTEPSSTSSFVFDSVVCAVCVVSVSALEALDPAVLLEAVEEVELASEFVAEVVVVCVLPASALVESVVFVSGRPPAIALCAPIANTLATKRLLTCCISLCSFTCHFLTQSFHADQYFNTVS